MVDPLSPEGRSILFRDFGKKEFNKLQGANYESRVVLGRQNRRCEACDGYRLRKMNSINPLR